MLTNKVHALRVMTIFGLIVVASLSLVGCGSADPAPDGQDGAPETVVEDPAEETGGIKKVSAAKLPALGDPLPPLDGGRVTELAPPKNWEPLGRDNKHVARFTTDKKNPNDLPRIMITAQDAAGFTEDVTAENVADFAASVAGEDKKFLEDPKPILIGDNAYARYVTSAKKGSRIVERQVLETVFDGRRYAIALEVYSENLTKSRDHAYAVAAAVKYVKSGGAAPAPMPSVEAPAEEKKEEAKSE